VTQLLSGALQEILLDGHLDIGILFEGNVSPLLRSNPLWSEQLYFITKPSPQWQGQDHITFEDCLNQPFILPGPKHGLRDMLDKEAAKIDKTINVVVEADSLGVHTELVCRGLGSTILSYEACRPHIDAGKLIALPLTNPKIKRICSLVWSKDFPLTRAAQAMADVIEDMAKDIFTPL